MKRPEVVLVGQPNAGKSTVFNVLSDIKATSSNFSGTSVEKAETDITINGREIHVVDLPGVYSFNPGDEAEKVTYSYLMERDIALIINVVDASMLSRSLELTVELLEFGIPMVIALNMWDETERKGVKIYPEKLQAALNVPVVTTSALLGKGVSNLLSVCYDMLFLSPYRPNRIPYTSHIEECVQILEKELKTKLETITENNPDHELTAENIDTPGNIAEKSKPRHHGAPRFFAIKAIENPEALPLYIRDTLSAQLPPICLRIEDTHHKDCHETISCERHHISMKLMEEVSHFIDRKKIPLREKMDFVLLHPWLGFFPLVAFIFAFFAVIYYAGSLLSILAAWPLESLPGIYEGLKPGHPFLWHTIDGVFQGLQGAIGVVMPYFLPLIFLMAVFEDTGYLSRMAFLLDGFMHRIGLHGKSTAPFILGFGCTVPALYGVRILENKRDRLLTAILLPFIPCSARTSVILALTAAFTGPIWVVFIYAFIFAIVAITGKILSLFLGKPTSFVMEIPDLKIPSLPVSLSKTWFKLKHFLSFAVTFLILGSIVMSWLEYFKVNKYIDKLLAPVVNGILGLPDLLGTTLVFGFFRKELVLVMANNAFQISDIARLPLSPEQVIVFIVFVTLYFPCFSTFVVMWKEFGKKIVFLASAVSIAVALAASYLLKIILVK